MCMDLDLRIEAAFAHQAGMHLIGTKVVCSNSYYYSISDTDSTINSLESHIRF